MHIPFLIPPLASWDLPRKLFTFSEIYNYPGSNSLLLNENHLDQYLAKTGAQWQWLVLSSVKVQGNESQPQIGDYLIRGPKESEVIDLLP